MSNQEYEWQAGACFPKTKKQEGMKLTFLQWLAVAVHAHPKAHWFMVPPEILSTDQPTPCVARHLTSGREYKISSYGIGWLHWGNCVHGYYETRVVEDGTISRRDFLAWLESEECDLEKRVLQVPAGLLGKYNMPCGIPLCRGQLGSHPDTSVQICRGDDNFWVHSRCKQPVEPLSRWLKKAVAPEVHSLSIPPVFVGNYMACGCSMWWQVQRHNIGGPPPSYVAERRSDGVWVHVECQRPIAIIPAGSEVSQK